MYTCKVLLHHLLGITLAVHQRLRSCGCNAQQAGFQKVAQQEVLTGRDTPALLAGPVSAILQHAGSSCSE